MTESRRGAALIVALFALIVVEALVAGIFFAARLEQQTGENTLFQAQAAAAADAGLEPALLGITPAALTPLSPEGPPLELPPIALQPGVQLERRIYRLASNLFLLRSESTRQDAGGGALARRAAGLLFQFRADSAAGTTSMAPIPRRAWVQLY